MIWFETTTRIDGDTEMGALVVLVTKLHTIMYSIGGVGVAIGTIIALIGAFFHYKRRQQRREKVIPVRNNMQPEIPLTKEQESQKQSYQKF